MEYLVGISIGGKGEIFRFPSKKQRDKFIADMDKNEVDWAIPAHDPRPGVIKKEKCSGCGRTIK